MADININFGTEDLKGLEKLLENLQKAIMIIKDRVAATGIILEDDVLKAKLYNAEMLRLDNEIKKQEGSAKRRLAAEELRAKKAQDALEKEIGIIGKLEKELKELDSARKAATNVNNINNYNIAIAETRRKLTDAKNTTQDWGKALESFQFKFNALGNIAGVAFASIASSVLNVIKQFVSFDKAIASTDLSADALEKVMIATNMAVTRFFGTLLGGDWSGFQKGIEDAIEAGIRYQETLDDLENKQRQLSITEADTLKRQSELIEIWKDPTGERTNKQKIAALEEYLKTEEKLGKERGKIAESFYEAERDRIAGLTGLTKDQIQQYLALYDTQEPFVKLGQEFLNLEEKRFKFVTAGRVTVKQEIESYAEKRRELEKQAEAYGISVDALIEYSNMINRFGDKDRQTVVDFYKSWKEAEVSYIEGNKRNLTALGNLRKQDFIKADDEFKKKIKDNEEAIKKQEKESEDVAKRTRDRLEKDGEIRIKAFNKENEEKKKAAKEINDILFDLQKEINKNFEDLEKESKDKADEDFLVRLKERVRLETLEEDDEKDRIDAIQKKHELQLAMLQEASNVATSLGDRQLQELEIRYQKDIQAAGDNESRKAEIDKQYQEKRKDILTKTAIAERALGIFSVVISTAKGVADAASKVATIPLIPYIIGLGALQAAAIIAAPMPKFHKGGLVTGDKDEIPILAQRDEFVVNKSAYQKNKELIEDVNKGKNIAYNFNVEDGYKIALAMRQDKAIKPKEKDYTKELLDYIKKQPVYGETKEFFIIHEGNKVTRIHKQ